MNMHDIVIWNTNNTSGRHKNNKTRMAIKDSDYILSKQTKVFKVSSYTRIF